MPGLLLLARETTNCGCSYDQATISDQMCRQESHVQLTPEEAVAAEESLSIYCKPVELYNILQRRAVHNPSFLQRCLNYKIQAKRNRRVQITVSLSENENDDGLSQNAFPLYVLLAKEVSNSAPAEYSAVYRVSEAYMLTAFSEMGRRGRTEAMFLVPDIKKLGSDAKSGDLAIIFLKQAKVEGYCSWGKFLVRSLCCSLEKSASLSLGHRVEMLSSVDMHASVLEPNFLNQENSIAFQNPQNLGNMNLSFQVKVNLSAQEVGAKERNPYNCYTYDDVPTSLLPHIIRLRSGNVIFNYRYYNSLLQKTEVTEDFTCPFCLVQCASFKGLRYHLTSCHDLFNFEFWLTEEYQAVNVSVKVEAWRSEIVADGVDPRLQTFFYCSRRAKRRSSGQMQNGSCSNANVKLDSPETERDSIEEDGGSNKEERSPQASPNDNCCQSTRHGSESGDSQNHIAKCIGLSDSGQVINGPCPDTAHVSATNECAQPVCGSSLASSAMLQFAKTRKLSVDRADPRNRTLLQKRQFFHSHRTQPMALEQVYSDHDSEDEVDDDIADLEDRRMLDDFVDVTKDEKQIMHLWNSFVRKQRVLADGHIPWACEGFSRLHGKSLVQSPALLWCWRIFLVKLWNHSLLDARTMNNCNIIIERYQNECSDPKEN